ncbi:MAG TPA: hypothetical protein VGJ32_02520 [Solirubrobacteraceae bacterium]
MSYETAVQQWRAGERRLQAAPPDVRRVLDRVVAAIVDELRRRLGGKFTADELSDLYDRGTGWCLDVAVTVAPDDPRAWEADTVADAAFARYLREAADYAGGRRLF